jgi:hypothetical protein
MHRMLDYEALSPKTHSACLNDASLQVLMLLGHVPSHAQKWGVTVNVLDRRLKIDR